VLCFEKIGVSVLCQRFVAYCKVATPVYAFFLMIDRIYQFYRFGSIAHTYIPLFAQEQRRLDPSLPPDFPWSTPFRVGLFGALFKPEKSIFLFDPLLIIAIILLVVLWKRLQPEVRAYGMTTLLLLLGYIAFYARYTYWSGDFAWGDRYVSTPAELATICAAPVLLCYRDDIGRLLWRSGTMLVAASLVIQFASLAFWLPLEIYQVTTDHPSFVIALRFKNIVAFALNGSGGLGLNNGTIRADGWDYVHLTTWNFLPFLLRRVGSAPGWIVNVSFVTWCAAIAALVWVLHRLRQTTSHCEKTF
jgi:hypothetical protein